MSPPEEQFVSSPLVNISEPLATMPEQMVDQGELLNNTPESQADQSEPLVAAAPVGGEDVDIADDRNTLENISAPATTSNESVEEAAPALGQEQNLEPLTSTGLAERLGVNESNISRNKGKGNEHFRRWSRKRDPDGIAWEHRLAAKLKYHPVI